MYDERLLSVICLQTGRDKTFIKEQGRQDPRPPIDREDNDLESHVKIALNFLNWMFSAYLRVREGPENGVECHEQRLGEDPSHVNGAGDHLLSVHDDVERRCFVAYLCRIDRGFRYLW